jgi:hypothetical protein
VNVYVDWDKMTNSASYPGTWKILLAIYIKVCLKGRVNCHVMTSGKVVGVVRKNLESKSFRSDVIFEICTAKQCYIRKITVFRVCARF